MKIRIKWILSFFLLVGLTGCASFGVYNEATGRKEFILISTAEEVAMGRDLHQQILRKYSVSSEEDQVARITGIGQDLAGVSDRRDYTYQFFLIAKDELNAFTIPGGRIYIFQGLVDKLNSDDEIASVLAHEIGHCAAKHTVKKFQAALGYNLIGSLIFSQIGGTEQAQKLATLSSNTLMQLIFSAYGRQDEHEADRLGIKYMHLAGYDLNGMINTLELLQSQAKGADVPVILRSHPHLKDRIIAVKQEIKRVQ